jgi:hypothetical protein
MSDDTVWPEPRLAPPVLHVPEPDTRHKEIPVSKHEALEFLRTQMTEERTDKAIQFVGDELKLVLPDIPVEIAERLLDWLLPEKVFAALEHALD